MMGLLIEAALRSLVLGFLVAVAMLAIRPRNPHLHKTVWLTVLLASVAMPFVIAWRVAPSIDAPAAFAGYLEINANGMGNAGGAYAQDLLAAFSSMPVRAMTAAYVLVALILLARLAIGLFAMWRIRRSATPLDKANAWGIDIRVSEKMFSPATFGSTVLLPASFHSWSTSQLEAVLSHERSHVLNKDCYVLWLARLHTGLFWFSPLAWWLQRRLALLAETTSDDAVIEASPDRTAYADLLLDIARNPPVTGVATSMARPDLSVRIERIISNIPPSSPPRRWVRGLAMALLIPPFTLAAASLQAPVAAQAAAPAVPATAATAEDPLKPKMIAYPTLELLKEFYPPEAKRHGINGIVSIQATIDPLGRVIGAKAVVVYPTDAEWGFGPAAEKLAFYTRFDNPLGVTTDVNFRTKFVLEGSVPPPSGIASAPDASSPATSSPK